MRKLPGLLSILKELWAGAGDAGAGHPTGEEGRRLAAAALLVEAARQDGDYAAEERALIRALLCGQFGLSAEEAEALLEGAEEAQSQATDLFRFTREAVEGMDQKGRETLIEMLWQVVLVDGTLDDYEASLMRRVAGLLYVSDHASAAARRRALERLEAARRED